MRVCDSLRAHVGLHYASETGMSKSSALTAKEGNGNKTVVCKSCKETGHREQNCFKKDKKCHKCGKLGHFARACPEEDEKEKSTEDEAPVTMMATTKCFKAVAGGEELPWIIDSGCTSHMSKKVTKDLQKHTRNVYLGNGAAIKSKATGRVNLNLQLPDKKEVEVKMTGVLEVNELTKNMFSVTACMKEGVSVQFDAESMKCKLTKAGELVGTASLVEELWVLDIAETLPKAHAGLVSTTSFTSKDVQRKTSPEYACNCVAKQTSEAPKNDSPEEWQDVPKKKIARVPNAKATEKNDVKKRNGVQSKEQGGRGEKRQKRD